MQEVIIFYKRCVDFLIAHCFDFLEMNLLGSRVYAFHAYIQVDRNVALLVDFQQAGSEKRHVIQFFGCSVKIQVHCLACTLLAGIMFCQQANFLGSTPAFVLGISICVDSTSACLGEFLYGFPSLLCTFEVVDAVGVSLSKCRLRDTFHLFPVDLDSGSQDQEVVGDLSVIFSCYLIPYGIDGGNRIFNPFDIAGHAVLLLSPDIIRLVHTRCDQGEARLIKLTVTGIDQSDIRLVQPAL